MRLFNRERLRCSKTLLVVGALAAAVSCSKDSTPPAAERPKSLPATSMEYVEICKKENDCKKFSRLVMGTDHLIQGDWTKPGAPKPSDESAYRVLDEAARQGINFFDTSPIYVGDVENRLGRWKAARASTIVENKFYLSPELNPDRKLYLLSKGGFPFDLSNAKHLAPGTHSTEILMKLKERGIWDPTNPVDAEGNTELFGVPNGTYASRLFGPISQITERVAVELGHTLKNLNNDITVYLMHRDDGDALGFTAVPRPQTPVKDIMEALSDEAVAGKFWALGWSNWQTDRIEESTRIAAEETKMLKPLINSPYFSLFEMKGERSIHALGVQVTHKEMMDPNFQKGMKIMPYSPLGGFSILDKPVSQWENAKAHAQKLHDAGDAYWQNVYPSIFTPENEARWRRLVQFTSTYNAAHNTNYTYDQMLNAYVLAHPRTDLLAIGAITVEQVQRTVGALALSKKLTAADLEYLYSGKR